MYIPTDSVNLTTVEYPQIRLGLQGEPGTGKTFAALTFPNPVVLNADNGLTAHVGEDIVSIPIHSDDWCIQYARRNAIVPRHENVATNPINRKVIVKHWIENEAPKLTSEQTLILDSWTRIQNYFDQQTRMEPSYTKTGSIDEYAFWDEKIIWSEEICGKFDTLQCHVVVTFHEIRDRDKKTGTILSKMQPAMQGKFVTRIAAYFTDFYRTLVFDRLNAEGKVIMTTLPGGNQRKEVDYFWQTKSDSDFNGKCRLNPPPPDWIKNPTFAHFKGYANSTSV